jgi:malonate-semialdehyde dehydrogenase (acetylating)/methylmalonate-semialdehyde dehydrogenase
MEFGRMRNLINGEWEDSVSSEVMPIRNPALDEVIGEVPMATEVEVAKAVQAAKEAFYDWRRTPPVSRARYLLRLIELLEENFEELSTVQTKEHGKTIDESRGETRRGIENVEVAAGIPSLMMGESLQDVASGIDEYIVREPQGVFACIPPFNFPFMVPLWFMPYALATGNTFVVKPSPNDPISQVKLHELLDEAGVPPGVVNVVHGGVEVANRLIDHPDVKGISFVGSTPVARLIYQRCGEKGKRVIAQGGAKNFLVIMPDADLDQTVASLMTSFYGNTGQRCLSGANAVVVGKDERFYKRFVDAFVDAASQIKVGYGLEEGIQMGPLQSKDKKERVLGYLRKGVEEGAVLRLDGRQVKVQGDYPETCFLNPSVFVDVTPEMTIGREEIFGPVAGIMRAPDLDRAIEMIHGNPHGNAAAIFTGNGGWAREFEYRVEAGNVGINIGVVAPMAYFPFSGMKDSFFGILHGQGKEAVRFFTESKVVIKRWF